MINYEALKFREEIVIEKLFSIHYFEFAKDYSFLGESHDFWEMVFVDTGQIYALANKDKYLLEESDAIFHKPNEYHNLTGTKKSAANVFIISFASSYSSMRFFEDRVLKLNLLQRKLIGQILDEYQNAFISPLDKPILPKLARNKNQVFGCEQLIKITLEKLLISIIRDFTYKTSNKKANTNISLENENILFESIENYLKIHTDKNLTQTQIAKDFGISVSMLKKIYSSKTKCGVIEHFSRIRINKAKKLIRMGNNNFSQIANNLGYSSIQQFSRQFKRITKKSPREYSKSILSMKDFDV